MLRHCPASPLKKGPPHENLDRRFPPAGYHSWAEPRFARRERRDPRWIVFIQLALGRTSSPRPSRSNRSMRRRALCAAATGSQPCLTFGFRSLGGSTPGRARSTPSRAYYHSRPASERPAALPRGPELVTTERGSRHSRPSCRWPGRVARILGIISRRAPRHSRRNSELGFLRGGRRVLPVRS